MTLSLHSRIVIAASVALAVFLTITGLVLDSAFRASAETALKDRLQGHIYALLGAAELNSRNELKLPADLPEPRFATPGSGLYAEVAAKNGNTIWRSPSAIALPIRFRSRPDAGERAYEQLFDPQGKTLYGLSFGVIWEDDGGHRFSYTFRVAESLEATHAQVQQFRRSLSGLLVGAVLLLLIVQGSILRWGLTPLRRVADDLAAIEAGRSRHLTGVYPRELRGLTENINKFITSAQSHLIRYRESLDNLAHSLKTPLAVIRSAIEDGNSDKDLRRITQDQIQRMTEIVDYQLQRAAASGHTPLIQPVKIAPLVKKITNALNKVYAHKSVRLRIDVDDSIRLHIDEGDLLEILGNLTDNAYKWCRSMVRIRVQKTADSGQNGERIELSIEDDGPGIQEYMVERVLQRGQRADPSIDGQGIGLAVVQETVAIYNGNLKIQKSELGGAFIRIRFKN